MERMPITVNWWGLEIATYNITFKWISGTRHKAADCISRLIQLLTNSKARAMMFTATNLDGPTFNTRSQTSQQCQTAMDTRPSNTPSIMNPATSDLTTVETNLDITQKPLTANRHEALLQMQRTDPFCKCISKWLSNGKAPPHEPDLFTHIKGL